jgi:hypothetical protein
LKLLSEGEVLSMKQAPGNNSNFQETFFTETAMTKQQSELDITSHIGLNGVQLDWIDPLISAHPKFTGMPPSRAQNLGFRRLIKSRVWCFESQ